MPHAAFRVLVTAALAFQMGQASSQVTSSPAAEARPKNILFFGNSYTYYNDMPTLVGAFASMDRWPAQIKAHTMPAAQLGALWGLRSTPYVLKEAKWDFVVLQEQSTLPLASPGRMRDNIRTIDSAIKDVGARTVLYMTWARENLPDTQPSITAAYSTIAAEIGALVAPVGSAWRVALQLDPKLPLFDPDGTHPSPTGSYLAACTLYLVISGSEQPCPSLDIQGVTSSDAVKARSAAFQAVTAHKAAQPVGK